MKRIISIFIMLFLLISISACTKVKTTTDASYFIDLVYQISKGDYKNGAVIDLRPLQNDTNEDDYDHGHIKGSLSYDYNTYNKEDFIKWITGLKSKKTTVLLIDSGKAEGEVIINCLKESGYKKVIYYKDGYQALKEDVTFKTKIEVATGIDDCGC